MDIEDYVVHDQRNFLNYSYTTTPWYLKRFKPY